MTRNLIAMEVSPTKEESKAVDGRINDTNLIGEKAVMAANSINKSMGWKQSRKISEEHKAEEQNARKAYAEQHHFTCEPIHADTKKEH